MGKEPIYWGGQIQEIVVTAKNKYREKLLNMPPEYYVYNTPAWRKALKYMRHHGKPNDEIEIFNKVFYYNREKVSRKLLIAGGVVVVSVYAVGCGVATAISWGATPQAAVFAETVVKTASSAAHYTYEGAKILGRSAVKYSVIGAQLMGHFAKMLGQKVVVHYSSPYPWLAMGTNTAAQIWNNSDFENNEIGWRNINVVSTIAASFNPLFTALSNAIEFRPFSEDDKLYYRSIFANKNSDSYKGLGEFAFDAGTDYGLNKFGNKYFNNTKNFELPKEFEKRATKEFGYSFIKTYYDTFIQSVQYRTKKRIINEK